MYSLSSSLLDFFGANDVVLYCRLMEPLRVNNRPKFGAIKAPTHDAGGPSGTNRRSGASWNLGAPDWSAVREGARLLARPPVGQTLLLLLPRPLAEGPNYNSFEREAGPLHAIR